MQASSSYTNPSLSIRGGEGPVGNMPVFATGGSTFSQYYVVARKADGSVTMPLYFGNAQPVSGAVPIPLQWYDLAPATSYDILVVTSSVIPVPPVGKWSVLVHGHSGGAEQLRSAGLLVVQRWVLGSEAQPVARRGDPIANVEFRFQQLRPSGVVYGSAERVGAIYLVGGRGVSAGVRPALSDWPRDKRVCLAGMSRVI